MFHTEMHSNGNIQIKHQTLKNYLYSFDKATQLATEQRPIDEYSDVRV